MKRKNPPISSETPTRFSTRTKKPTHRYCDIVYIQKRDPIKIKKAVNTIGFVPVTIDRTKSPPPEEVKKELFDQLKEEYSQFSLSYKRSTLEGDKFIIHVKLMTLIDKLKFQEEIFSKSPYLHALDLISDIKLGKFNIENMTRGIFKKYHFAYDSEYITHLDVSSRDSISFQSIQFPVRSLHCDGNKDNHYTCFDLLTFLEYNSSEVMRDSKDRWKCPICKSRATPASLYVDMHFKALLDVMKEKKLDKATISFRDGSMVESLPSKRGSVPIIIII